MSAGGDFDGDGVTNLQECNAGTHPRGFFARYFAEGATGAFFATRFAVANTRVDRSALCTICATTAHVLFRFQRDDGVVITEPMAIGSGEQRTIDPRGLPGLESASFSTIVESDFEVVVERTMTWGERRHGSHSEGSLEAPHTTWYFGEGATHSGFQLFYLLQNPSPQTAEVTVTYLLPEGRAPKVETYQVAPESRRTILGQPDRGSGGDRYQCNDSRDPADRRRARDVSRRGRRDVGSRTRRRRPDRAVEHVGVWRGRDRSVLRPLRPARQPRHTSGARSRHVPAARRGPGRQRSTPLPGQSRTTLFVDVEDPRLQDTAVSTVIEVLDDVPIVAERSMWWGQPWVEAHVSRGATSGAPIWAFADGELGGADQAETFLLLANASLQEGRANVTLLRR